jgi:hypothetical protein
MAKRLVNYELDDGSTVTFEADDATRGIVPAARGQEEVVRATETFEQALERIKPAVNTLRTYLDGLSANEVQVTFGLKVSAEAGMIIASGAVEANYAVTLKWVNRKEPPPDKSG